MFLIYSAVRFGLYDPVSVSSMFSCVFEVARKTVKKLSDNEELDLRLMFGRVVVVVFLVSLHSSFNSMAWDHRIPGTIEIG